MREDAVALVLAFLSVAGCGEQQGEPSVEDALGKLTGALDSSQHAPLFVAEGLDALRGGVAAIQGTKHEDLRIDRDKAERQLRDARVVLVADLHLFDAIRRAFASLVFACGGQERIRTGKLGLALEAVPFPLQERIEAARAGGVDEVRQVLELGWSWPVRACAELLEDPRLRACPVLAVGGPEIPKTLPGSGVPDRERRPVPVLELDSGETKYGTSYALRNDICAAQVQEWLKSDPARKVLVLYGAAHILGERGIKAKLEALGVDVVAILPLVPEWELALRRRFGPSAAKEWFEVLPGALRGPLVSDAEILREAALVPDSREDG